jgi:hypothetical protein
MGFSYIRRVITTSPVPSVSHHVLYSLPQRHSMHPEAAVMRSSIRQLAQTVRVIRNIGKEDHEDRENHENSAAERTLEHSLTRIQQCLALHPGPLRRRNVHHVGDNIPRTTSPAHFAATKRSTRRTKPRAIGWMKGEVYTQSTWTKK